MDKKFHITPEAFNAIMAGLSELPWKVANPVMTDLRRQAQELNEAGQQPKEPGKALRESVAGYPRAAD